LTLYRVNPKSLSADLHKLLETWEQVIDKTRVYAPALVAQWEKPAKAYNLRYLARQAIRLQAGSMAAEFMHRALATYWRLLLEKPRSTLSTWIAAYLLWFLPRPLYCQIEKLALKKTAATQRQRILQDLSGELV